MMKPREDICLSQDKYLSQNFLHKKWNFYNSNDSQSDIRTIPRTRMIQNLYTFLNIILIISQYRYMSNNLTDLKLAAIK